MSITFKKKNVLVLEVACHSKLNLLAHAQLEELDLGSRCGGFGECGGDRIQIRGGAAAVNPVTELEREHLSAAEISEGFRLACQCYPDQNDAVIEISLES